MLLSLRRKRSLMSDYSGVFIVYLDFYLATNPQCTFDSSLYFKIIHNHIDNKQFQTDLLVNKLCLSRSMFDGITKSISSSMEIHFPKRHERLSMIKTAGGLSLFNCFGRLVKSVVLICPIKRAILRLESPTDYKIFCGK